MVNTKRWVVVIVLWVSLVTSTLVLVLAPYLYAEAMGTIEPHQIIKGQVTSLSRGQMLDDYWAVEKIAPGTFAIGEPRYYQQNYAYLLLGTTRALLFDTGSGTRDIRPVLAKLTRLPITALPSHLHYDHTGGIMAFPSVAMIDMPETRADVRDGWFEPGRYEFLGMVDHLKSPRFRVTQWVKPGEWIDLGGRRVRLLSTPGHTPTSASLYDPRYGQLFAGDFVYPGPLYVQLPGASRSAYRSTASSLLSELPSQTRIWSAHCCRTGEAGRAPWLTMHDLAELRGSLDLIAAGKSVGHGIYPRAYSVNGQMRLLTGFPWTNR